MKSAIVNIVKNNKRKSVMQQFKDKIKKQKKTTDTYINEEDEDEDAFQINDDDLENDDALSDEYEEASTKKGGFRKSSKK